MKRMIDIHMHIIPEVDDGSCSLEMSEEILRMAQEQGIDTIIATSHSDAFEVATEKTRTNYRKLRKRITDLNIPVKVYLGCEVYCEAEYMDAIIEDLSTGRIPSMNGTKYVLAEFYDITKEDAFFCVEKMISNGWLPILAHVERYLNLDIEAIKELKEKGCLVQINVYSADEEENAITKGRARDLLQEQLVDFMGSDAHRSNRRPPAVEQGIAYLYENYEKDYVDKILFGNAETLLLAEKVKTDYPSAVDKNIWLEGIMGVVVGDALGMPVQFAKRSEIKEAPITEMDGFGTYDMPMGSWSDDSSLTLATLASIRDNKCIDATDIMKRFVKWLYLGEYTPFGESFDQGKTCVKAIMDYVKNQDVNTCGQNGEYANGNGALMRIMPVCLWVYEKQKGGAVSEEEAVEWIHEVSGLTHNHLRSKMACVMYYYMIKAILETEGSLREKLQKGVDDAVKFYHGDIANYVELAHYGRLFHLVEFAGTSENAIRSSGYVVDSLEAAVWSLITTEGFEGALLKAVNLGGDKDTIGAIAGGLAGLYYGYEEIPEEWLEVIQKREWIEGMCEV